MQDYQLFLIKKQKDPQGPLGTLQVLQDLPQAYSTQRNEVTKIPLIAGFCLPICLRGGR